MLDAWSRATLAWLLPLVLPLAGQAAPLLEYRFANPATVSSGIATNTGAAGFAANAAMTGGRSVASWRSADGVGVGFAQGRSGIALAPPYAFGLFGFGEAFTVEALARLDALPASAMSLFDDYAPGLGLRLSVNGSGQLGALASLSGSGPITVTSPQALGLDRWRHVALAYDGLALSLLPAGALAARAPASGQVDRALTLRPGIARGVDGASEPWRRALDDFRLHTVALGPSELNRRSPAAEPLAATLPMLLGALGVLGLARRRRPARTAGWPFLSAGLLLSPPASATDVLYHNAFETPTALGDFQLLAAGSARLGVVDEALRIEPGPRYLDRGVAALRVPEVAPAYRPRLDESPGPLAWSFNVANQDGSLNNLFGFYLWSSADSSDPAGFGYSLRGGGLVGERMVFARHALTGAPGGVVYDELIQVADGLGTLPATGAVRLTYAPAAGRWTLYFEQALVAADPLTVRRRVGVADDRGFTGAELPYVLLTSEATGHAAFDNLSVQQLPAPPAFLLLASAGVVLAALRRASGRGW